jgi:6-pyruvoyltetrahydropterin/6-carboxytetrahydropterin synthase
MYVTKEFSFEAAHRLMYDDGDCRNLHGHSYRVEVCVQGRRRSDGKVVCFKEMNCVKEWLDKHWEHATLLNSSDTDLVKFLHDQRHKLYVFPGIEPTAENMCATLALVLKTLLENKFHVYLKMVRVHETAKCCATWSMDDTSEEMQYE